MRIGFDRLAFRLYRSTLEKAVIWMRTWFGHACEQFDLANLDVLLSKTSVISLCPAAFDLGEDAKVVILSVTEGEDNPSNTPTICFYAASVMLLNKVDLLPYLEFDGRPVWRMPER